MMKRIVYYLSLACTLVLLQNYQGVSQVLSERMWVTDGDVYAVAPAGDKVFIGGTFNYIGPSTGSFVTTDASTGAALQPLPLVAGDVYTMVADGSGGWYIGGRF